MFGVTCNIRCIYHQHKKQLLSRQLDGLASSQYYNISAFHCILSIVPNNNKKTTCHSWNIIKPQPFFLRADFNKKADFTLYTLHSTTVHSTTVHSTTVPQYTVVYACSLCVMRCIYYTSSLTLYNATTLLIIILIQQYNKATGKKFKKTKTSSKTIVVPL